MTTPHTYTQTAPFTGNTSNPPVIHSESIPFLSPLPLLILFSLTPIPPPPPLFWQRQGALTKWVCVSYCLSRKWDFSRWMERFWGRNAILRQAAPKRMDCYRYRLPLSSCIGEYGDGLTLSLAYPSFYQSSWNINIVVEIHTYEHTSSALWGLF